MELNISRGRETSRPYQGEFRSQERCLEHSHGNSADARCPDISETARSTEPLSGAGKRLPGIATYSPPMLVPASRIPQKKPCIPDFCPKCRSTVSFLTQTSKSPIRINAQGTIFNRSLEKVAKLCPDLLTRLKPQQEGAQDKDQVSRNAGGRKDFLRVLQKISPNTIPVISATNKAISRLSRFLTTATLVPR